MNSNGVLICVDGYNGYTLIYQFAIGYEYLKVVGCSATICVVKWEERIESSDMSDIPDPPMGLLEAGAPRQIAKLVNITKI